MEAFFTMFGDPAWMWLALGLLLLIAEMATGTLFLLGPGVAALLVALIAGLFSDGLSTEAQLTVFALLGVAFTVVGRSQAVRRRLNRGGDRPLLNRKADQLIGRRVTASEAFESGEGAVRLNDTRYLARLNDGRADPVPAGAALVIRKVEGVTLVVEPE